MSGIPDYAKLDPEEIWETWYNGSDLKRQMEVHPDLDQAIKTVAKVRKMIMGMRDPHLDLASEKAWNCAEAKFLGLMDDFFSSEWKTEHETEDHWGIYPDSWVEAIETIHKDWNIYLEKIQGMEEV